MSKLCRRNFLFTAFLILISFLLLGGAFTSLSYRYTMSERTGALARDSEDLAGLLGYEINNGLGASDLELRQTMRMIARISDVDVMLAGTDGEVYYYTDGEGKNVFAGFDLDLSGLLGGDPQATSTGMSTLGFYEQKHFVAVSPICLRGKINSVPVAYVLVAAPTHALAEMWTSLALLFLLVAGAVLCIAMAFSYFTSVKLTRPLKEMADTVRRFGQGEYDVRVQNCGRDDEVGELGAAFNSMADSIALAETKRQEFVANISHELKTPMTTISGFTDGILDGTIPQEKVPEYLQIVSSETKRLARLVRKMLDLSKLQAKESAVVGQEKFDLCETMCQVLISLETKINDRRLNVDAQLPEDAVMVWGEADAITQVGYNLLDNAIKFSPEGGTIGMKITTRDKKAYVTVTNLGPELSQEELKLIFDRFHKSDKSRSIDKDGVGLGLYIVKSILNNHREDITVTSEHGQTSFTFTMTLAG